MAVFTAETIYIENLRVACVIGVHAEERMRRQPLVVNVSMEQSFAKAAEHDRIGHTVDYSALSKAIQDYVSQSEFQLLEALARHLAEHLAERFPIERMSIHIRKPEAIMDADAAAVGLTWVRNGAGSS